ncbi:hypothetical protein L5515_010383 [Caenorhabditis briggsae]|uniref:TNFR-Cys domain-containing protein n=1 Tax=Caenorhabditis briggsae TaxID=6238 RepID=A0AAE9JFV9_CAEBR|nr:hypothetical protein L5515_010383 [Caenorhabditis briggsae]
MIIFWLLFILFPKFAQSVTCPACPTDGILSEWTTNDDCEAPCGGCANLTYSRTCLSTDISASCTCKGPTTTSKPCNTQACNFPRANSPKPPCCDGSQPIVVNNWYHCGKVENLTPNSYCCPDGGVWGEWSVWVKGSGRLEYSRTRKCLSNGFKCKCEGEPKETINGCPCPPLSIDTSRCDDSTKISYNASRQENQYNPASCTATLILERSNFRGTFYKQDTVDNTQNMLTYIAYIENGKCQGTRFKAFDGMVILTNGLLDSIVFQCDIVTKMWNGLNPWVPKNMTNVTAAAQMVFI